MALSSILYICFIFFFLINQMVLTVHEHLQYIISNVLRIRKLQCMIFIFLSMTHRCTDDVAQQSPKITLSYDITATHSELICLFRPKQISASADWDMRFGRNTIPLRPKWQHNINTHRCRNAPAGCYAWQ